MIVLLRHASAGERDDWHGDDRLRPLDKRGKRDAKKLAEQLRDLGVRRLVSSPYVRCVQTLEPLAENLGIEIERDDRLAEGADAEDALAIARPEEPAVLCTHGDVVVDVLGRKLKKGAFALLDR